MKIVFIWKNFAKVLGCIAVVSAGVFLVAWATCMSLVVGVLFGAGCGSVGTLWASARWEFFKLEMKGR